MEGLHDLGPRLVWEHDYSGLIYGEHLLEDAVPELLPPKIHATIGKSSTQQSAQEQTWGYSSTQQTSYTQTSQVASKSSWSQTWPLAYGNILYLVGEQYYGNLGTVPFVGINNLTFEACNIVLCENAGVSTTFTPSVQQLIYGGFTGVYYTTALVVSAGSFASD